MVWFSLFLNSYKKMSHAVYFVFIWLNRQILFSLNRLNAYLRFKAPISVLVDFNPQYQNK